MTNASWRRAGLGLAVLFVLLAVPAPAHADTTSDLFALFFQASNVAFQNDFTLGERTSLVAKVIHAIADVERGNENAAAGALGSFLNEVDALERSGRISPADAQALSDAANAILNQL